MIAYLVRGIFTILLLPWVQLLYRVQKLDRHHVPKEGGVLLLSNHVSYIDAFIIYLSCPRPVRFVILDNYMKVKPIAWFLRLFGCIPIHPKRAREAIDRTVQALKEDTVVCLFPEGGLTRTGVLGELKKGFEIIIRKSECTTVPVYMDGLWSSIFSFERGAYFKKLPRGLTCPLQVAFGEPITDPKKATTATVREGILMASHRAFCARPSLQNSLSRHIITNLRRKGNRAFYSEVDHKITTSYSRREMLELALRFRAQVEEVTTQEDIAIVLPRSPECQALQLACCLANRRVTLFPHSEDQTELRKIGLSIGKENIQTVITDQAHEAFVTEYAQVAKLRVYTVENLVERHGSAFQLTSAIKSRFLPVHTLASKGLVHPLDWTALRLWDPENPAELIELSERQIISNALQITGSHFFQLDERILCESSAASIHAQFMGMWGPLFTTATTGSRKKASRKREESLPTAIGSLSPTLLVGSRENYAEIGSHSSLGSIPYGILFSPDGPAFLDLTGDGIAPCPVVGGWSDKGGVLSLSRTAPDLEGGVNHQPQAGAKNNSVGRALPGTALRTQDDALFYLPPWREATAESWIRFPDETELDDEGFLFLPEGRA